MQNMNLQQGLSATNGTIQANTMKGENLYIDFVYQNKKPYVAFMNDVVLTQTTQMQNSCIKNSRGDHDCVTKGLGTDY